jgi:dolichol-phosphate mannosyltransferase
VVAELTDVLAGSAYEIVIVNDGSVDETRAVLDALQRKHAQLRCVHHEQSLGKSAAILTGVRAAGAPLVVTLDGDGQNDPRAVLPLLDLLRASDVGLAAGQRVRHAHSTAKRLSSRAANSIRALLLADDARDSACCLKAFPRELYLQLPYFHTMHRFLPALVKNAGSRVAYLDVVDRPRLHGRSKYGVVDRALTGVVDLVGVCWLLRRRRRLPPDHH